MVLRIFGFSFAITALGVIGSLVLGGPAVAVIVTILIVLEVSLSFDNAVVNARILERMSEWWQKIFLTVGILIAVFGMRLLFPLLIVAVTAGLGPFQAVELARAGGSPETPGTYANYLDQAQPSIAAFGGMFLGMLFLDFMFEEREHTWLTFIERPLQRLGQLDNIATIVALVALVLSATLLADGDVTATVMTSGVLGVVTYLLVNGLGELFERLGGLDEEGEELVGIHGHSEQQRARGGATALSSGEALPTGDSSGGPSELAKATGKAAFFLFLYLEVLDASFSFDGVIGAFAITNDIFVIAVGLGVGAMYIRSLTVYLVRKGTLDDYVYLEHGAHWAIGALAVLLLVSIKVHAPEVVTGLVGVGFIVLALFSSIRRNRQLGTPSEIADREGVPAGT